MVSLSSGRLLLHSIVQSMETRFPRTLIGPRGSRYSKLRSPVAELGDQSSEKTVSESSVPFPDVCQEISIVNFVGEVSNSHTTSHFKSSPGLQVDFFNRICNDISGLFAILDFN